LERVIDLARHSVHSGIVSERGLAKRANISQPHLHNVLKGIRALSPDAADRVMRALGTTVPQMLWSGSGTLMSEIREVPLLRDRIGPGSEASFSVFRGYVPFSSALISPLEGPVAAYLAADLAIPPEFQRGDLALLDLNPARRVAPALSSGWVVADNAGLRVRYVRRAGGWLEVGSDFQAQDTRDWHKISLRGRDILEIVRARIVWIGREMETPLAGPYGAARSGN
jgi:hypothetical protein